MKKFLICILLLPVFAHAQKKITKPKRDITTAPATNGQFTEQMALNCNNTPSPRACNYITNNTFQGVTMPLDINHTTSPFSEGLIPGWVNENGSPNIYDGLSFNPVLFQPPFPGFGFASFGSLVTRNFITGEASSSMEGISQHIPATVPGHKYVLSFYRRCEDIFEIVQPGNPPNLAGNANVSDFKIYLTNCSYHNSHNTDLFTPTIPSVPVQAIYCETNVPFDGPWQRIMVTFTADAAYTLFYANSFLALQNFPNSYTETGILLSYPELIDVTAQAATIPAPTVSNCNATLTAPACAPVNTQLVWHGPSGQSIATAPAQATTVSITDPANIGTWTLSVTAADAVNTNTTCGTFANGGINFPVTVSGSGACPIDAGLWPKVYYGTGALALLKNNATNNLLGLIYSDNFSPNINHTGFLPSFPYSSEGYTFHYNTATGSTNFARPGVKPLFALNSGDIQAGDLDDQFVTSFFNGSTGNSSTTPVIVPANEIIIAEPSFGGFVTKSNNAVFYHSSTTNLIINTTGCIVSKYNLTTNKLYVIDNYYSFKVYQLSNSNAILISSSPNWQNFLLFQIDNQDRVYVQVGSFMKQYDYINNIYNTVSVPVFSTTPCYAINSINPYTSDICLVYVFGSPNKFYAIDFNNQSVKSVGTTGTFGSEEFTYIADGNTLYLSGRVDGGSIGTQTIPALPSIDNNKPVFITKLNLQNDFALRNIYPAVNAEMKLLGLSPNPSNNEININIQNGGRQHNEKYSVTITSKMGKMTFHKDNCPSSFKVNVSKWEHDVYYIEAINSKGEKVTGSFIKL